MYRNYFKRIFDVVLSLILLFLFLPLKVLIFFLIWFKIGYPIFSQKRPGKNNQLFTLYKFKTLYDVSKNISKKKRKNTVGDFLRKTGLDELPQLINILQNKMSLIGPRPLLTKYLKIQEFKNHERKTVKPGITGLAQIGTYDNIYKKKNLKWKKQFELDKYYAKNLSFKLDLIIIIKTFLIMISFSKKDYHHIKEVKLSKRDLK